jgi:hypothetical protein
MVIKRVLCCAMIVGFSINLAACNISKSPQPQVPIIPDETQLHRKVAVLPFVNKTSDPNAAETVRKMFYNFFSSLNYLDVEPSIVESSLREKELYKTLISGGRVSPQKLGQILGVDAIILGDVISFGKVYAILYTEARAGLRARFVSCKTGQAIWELEHTTSLRKGDVPLSLTGLAKSLVTSLISYKQTEAVKAAAALCMEMVDTIPNPPAIMEPPPRIKVFVHNGAGTLLRPGDYLRVAMIGDPGHKGSWEIFPRIKNIPMEEKEPGTYLGSYKVASNDRLSYGRLVGHLRSNNNSVSHWIDVLGPVSLGQPTILPKKFTRDTVLGPEKSPYIVKEVLVVQPGVNLVVKPGAIIWFNELGIVIRGAIRADGTRENPIRFCGFGTSTWKGIFIEGNRGNHIFSHCVISGAEYGLRTFDSNVMVNRCLFQDNKWALVSEGGVVQIQESHLRTSEETGLSVKKSKILVTGSVISENKSGGILLQACDARIEHNNILNNGRWEIKILDDGNNLQVRNNWWGSHDISKIRLIGSAEVEPILKGPIDFELLGEMNY